MKIKIGSRGSKLALAQTNYVLNRLKEAYPQNDYEIVVIKTTGDIETERPLDQIGSKGIFVEQIEEALLKDQIQLAVHSMKDMPDNPRQGLVFTKSWPREEAKDLLILKKGNSYKDLPYSARVATGSKRRSYQLLKLRPDINIVPIRGNIDTRIKKLYDSSNNLDAIILAAAGINRLSIDLKNTYLFTSSEMIPAPAQGTLAIEAHETNTDIIDMVNSLADSEADIITSIERGFLNSIGGDCHLPVGAYAYKKSGIYYLEALFGSEDGSRLAKTIVSDMDYSVLVNHAIKDIKTELEDNHV